MVTAGTAVVTLQNGRGNIEALEAIGPRTNLVAGVTTIGTELLGPGRIRSLGTGTTYGRQVDGRPGHAVDTVRGAFDGSAITVTESADVHAMSWEKIAFNGVLSTLYRLLQCPVSARCASRRGSRRWSMSGGWTMQQARNLLMGLGGRADEFRLLVLDRAGQFTASFGVVLADTDIKVVKSHHDAREPTPTPSSTRLLRGPLQPSPTPPRPTTHTTTTRSLDRRAGLHVDTPPTSPRRSDQPVRTHSHLTAGQAMCPPFDIPQPNAMINLSCAALSCWMLARSVVLGTWWTS